ncbi:MAG: T9SS type A sorting domain-containing protein [Ignavibacteriaceae bacterium]|nr:T9SS type A sorting domain-containing protein [Ignavibacteriaceae bacterium]
MKIASILLMFVFAMSLTFGQSDIANVKHGGGVQMDTIPPMGFPYPQLFNFNYSTVNQPLMNGGTVGAMFVNGKYYFNRWNGTSIYRYNPDGTGGGPGTLSDSLIYAGSIRDLATDGTRLFGGNAATGIIEIDPNTGATVKSFTLTGGSTRAIAWDATRKGFWNTGFSGNLLFHDTTGTLQKTITSTLTGKYGMAFDSVQGMPAYLWVWNQASTTTNSLHKYNIETGLEEISFVFTLPGTSIGTAGGAEICVKDGNFLLLLNYQNFALVGYDIGDFIVPVEFSSFSASTVGSDVILNWSTATEKNNQGFEVLRKTGNGEFTVIGYIQGNGTSLSPQNYSYVEKNVPTGQHSYRLRQIDFDGSYAFSSVVEIDVTAPTQFELSQNFPNPFNPATTISFNLAVDSKVTLKVFNTLGQEISVLANASYAAGTYNLSFDASSLTSGLYLYSLEAIGVDGTNYKSTKKMILNK